MSGEFTSSSRFGAFFFFSGKVANWLRAGAADPPGISSWGWRPPPPADGVRALPFPLKPRQAHFTFTLSFYIYEVVSLGV